MKIRINNGNNERLVSMKASYLCCSTNEKV